MTQVLQGRNRSRSQVFLFQFYQRQKENILLHFLHTESQRSDIFLSPLFVFQQTNPPFFLLLSWVVGDNEPWIIYQFYVREREIGSCPDTKKMKILSNYTRRQRILVSFSRALVCWFLSQHLSICMRVCFIPSPPFFVSEEKGVNKIGKEE